MTSVLFKIDVTLQDEKNVQSRLAYDGDTPDVLGNSTLPGAERFSEWKHVRNTGMMTLSISAVRAIRCSLSKSAIDLRTLSSTSYPRSL